MNRPSFSNANAFSAVDDIPYGEIEKFFHNVNDDKAILNPKEHNPQESTNADKNLKIDLNAADQQQKNKDEAIDEIISNLSDTIGDLEFQIGVECVMHGKYDEAVEHFHMSSSLNNVSACYNLALLYEQGLGVKKDLNNALKLYKLAGEHGHDKALYNMGVYYAKGIGGVKKSFKNAKLCFEKAASLGNLDAVAALSLLILEKKK